MKKIYLIILTLLSITSYSQYITNSSTVSNYTADLKHNGTLAIGDKEIEQTNYIPFQIKYAAKDRNIIIPIRNGSGGFEFNIAGGPMYFDPIAKAGDGVLKLFGGRDFIFSFASSVSLNAIPGENGVQRYIFAGQNYSKTMIIFNTGKVTMGTDKYDLSGYRLFVKDGIKTDLLKVEVASENQWADHVFNDDYNLMPINEVKKFITENNHLPNIPSAKQIVDEGGIEQGELNAKLLEKIEELTLHLIEQDEKINKLTQEINHLKQK